MKKIGRARGRRPEGLLAGFKLVMTGPAGGINEMKKKKKQVSQLLIEDVCQMFLFLFLRVSSDAVSTLCTSDGDAVGPMRNV